MSSMTRRDAMRLLGLGGLMAAGCSAPAEEEESDEGADAIGSSCGRERVRTSAATAPEELRRYEKIVVLMMENRSFDHYFGHLSLPKELGGEGRKDVDGLTGNEVNYLVRPGSDGREAFRPFRATGSKLGEIVHSWEACHGQFNNGANDGFIQEHFNDIALGKDGECKKICAGIGDPMAYYGRTDTPVFHELFDNYAICDRWFASVMGPTWPNRAYLHAATSTGHKENRRMSTDSEPETPSSARTMWHELKDKCLSAKNYYVDLSWSLGGFGVFNSVPKAPVFRQGRPIGPREGAPVVTVSFEEACERGTLPTVSMIDPAYIFAPNDDHPPHDIKSGQAFVSAIYKMLTKNLDQWSKTLLIITYDEHGSFYDHVAPPRVEEDEREEFKQLGFRVPSLVIGPYVKKNFVSKVQYDHVSFLSTITRRFGLKPLNRRVDATNDIRDCIDRNAVETDGVPGAPIALRNLVLSESQIHESIRDSLGQAELANAVLGGPATLEQKKIATDQLLQAYDRIGVAAIRR
jgi:phospholipase C